MIRKLLQWIGQYNLASKGEVLCLESVSQSVPYNRQGTVNRYITIREAEVCEIQPCICGEFPDFEMPDDYHTDCWLRCPKCGRRTDNTGGYLYASEIPLQNAKQKAVELWNSGEIYMKG